MRACTFLPDDIQNMNSIKGKNTVAVCRFQKGRKCFPAMNEKKIECVASQISYSMNVIVCVLLVVHDAFLCPKWLPCIDILIAIRR